MTVKLRLTQRQKLDHNSLIFMPLPHPTEESADPKKMTLYAICLANRSAALYHLREYHYCVRDIDEALEHHYPKVRQEKEGKTERYKDARSLQIKKQEYGLLNEGRL